MTFLQEKSYKLNGTTIVSAPARNFYFLLCKQIDIKRVQSLLVDHRAAAAYGEWKITTE